MRITIRYKLFILVAIIVVTYGLAVAFIVANFREKLTDDAKQLTMSYLNENASTARTIINSDFEIARTIANTLANTVDFETSNREALTAKVLEGTVRQNPRYLSAWLSMELSAVDPSWDRPFGRKRYTYYQSGAPVFDTINQTGDVVGSLYHSLKQSKAEELTEPYLLSSTSSVKDDRNDYLGTSVCVPLLKNGNFLGLTGMDITLEALDFIANIKPFEGASSFLVSNDGIIVSHENKEVIGKTLSQIVKSDTARILSTIKSSRPISLQSDIDGTDSFIAFTPLPIGVSSKPWSIGTIVPMSAITQSIQSIIWKTIAISIAGLLILIASVMWISNRISNPINQINDRLKELAKGHIRQLQSKDKISNDEIGEMIESVNTLEANLKSKINFAVAIGSGNFETAFQSAGDNDTLGEALMTMRTNLKKVREDDERRAWTNEGLAKINDILRVNTDKTDEFYHQILRTLITFLQGNQGAMFLVEDEDENPNDKYLKMVAAFAYDRKKYIDSRLGWGESLVGQCVLERELMYLREIPKQYIKITSGLGEATPTVLVIVPLKTDREVVGAIEIASFVEFHPHEIQFIEKASEIIASSIATYRNAARTKSLLENVQRNQTERQSWV